MTDVAQRWRILFGRGPDASHLSQRDELEAWEAAIAASGLPVATGGGARPRPRISTAVPLPVGMTAAAEPLEIVLEQRRTAAEVRRAIAAVLPADHHLIDVHDVWTGAPSLPASVTAADYLVVLTDDAPEGGATQPTTRLDPDRLHEAVARLLAAETLPRERRKADRSVAYDLRPFLLALEAVAGQPSARGEATIRMTLRVDPQLGAGRPDEVVAALADELGRLLGIARAERIRFRYVDDPPHA